MSNLTCLNCSVRFQTFEQQRDHFKTDWHRYNLKRKIAELPPVSAEGFEKLLNEQRNAEKSQSEDNSLYCKACGKLFKTINAHDNHLNSKKHKEALKRFVEQHADEDVSVKATGESKYEQARPFVAEAESDDDDDDDMEVEEVDSDEWEADENFENPIANNNCLFCDHHSKNIVNNVKHMSLEHSFFIPDAEFVVDLEGLLSYLAEKICKYFICIWCNDRGKTFYSMQGARKHMIDKGHCKMLHEGAALAEYVDFYDYSTSYPDAGTEGMDIDAEIDPEENTLDGDDYQLVLPSGITIGHRSLMRYYNQRINPNRAVVVKKSDKKMHKVLAEYKSIGWTSTNQEMAARNARDIHTMKRQMQKLQQKIGIKANKLQKHYRAQVMF
ncbi:cytoplasmic 60S subunit biogenesis factor ZNF622 [Culicoides brevitarsis]|uniref:cytoplasmic 60S subunit biogenesis factor ZNF622 n=1 Tax=Culicoides brevitarsis TaxID=469753 RepID=UPI00307C75DF